MKDQYLFSKLFNDRIAIFPKQLGEEERKPYEEDSLKDRERFKDEMLGYQERHPEFCLKKRKLKGKTGQTRKREKLFEELSEMEDIPGAKIV